MYCTFNLFGEMVEWFKAAVLKTAEAQASVGSNPTLSAIYFLSSRICRQDKLRFDFSKSRCYREFYDNSASVLKTHSDRKIRPGFRKFSRF